MGTDPPGYKINTEGSLSSSAVGEENSGGSSGYFFYDDGGESKTEDSYASNHLQSRYAELSTHHRVHSTLDSEFTSLHDGLLAVREHDSSSESKEEIDQDQGGELTGQGSNSRSNYRSLYGSVDLPKLTPSMMRSGSVPGTHALASNPDSYLRTTHMIVNDHNANSMLELPLVPAIFAGSYCSEAPDRVERQDRCIVPLRTPKQKSAEDKACLSLQDDQMFPRGLAVEAVMGSRLLYPLRIWLVDNNRKSTDGYELQDCLDDQVLMAKTIDISTILCFLNKDADEVGEFTILSSKVPNLPNDSNVIDPREEDSSSIDPQVVQRQVAEMIQRSRESPNSSNQPPWSDLVDDLVDRVEFSEDNLLQDQQKVLITIATNSLVPDDRLIRKLKQLSRLPVKLVVRLFRANDPTIGQLQYKLKKAKLPVTVLGDFEIHHSRVALLNPWLNYALPLHRCRELGVEPSVVALLDQRILSEFELREFLVLLFGKTVMMEAPDLHTEWPRFHKFIAKVNSKNGRHFSSRTGRGEKWLNMSELSYFYGHPEMKSPESCLAAESVNSHGPLPKTLPL